MTNPKKKSYPLKLTGVNNPAEIAGIFLKEGMNLDEEISSTYNLNKEFAAIKTNRSYPVLIAIISFTILLIAVTCWFTFGITREIDRISVGISDFKDLNLADLMNALKKAEIELKNIDDKIALTKQAMNLEVEKIRRDAEVEIKKVEASGLGQAEKNRLVKKIQDDNDHKIKVSTNIYEERIKASQRETEETRNRVKNLETKVAVEKADYEKTMNLSVKSYKNETAKQIDDQKQIFDNRMEEQKREYQKLLTSYEKELKDSRNENAKDAENIHNIEELLDLYKKALLYYAKTRGEHGYVIDCGADGNMLVDVNPYITIKKGDRAYVLNQDNKILAFVELYPEGIRLKAKILKRMNQGEIRSFDKILLLKNQAL